MEKDFDAWNEYKKVLEKNNFEVKFSQGDIWWMSIGMNLKTESCGKGEFARRPVLILKKLSATTFIGIPLSTQIKEGTWFYNYRLDDIDYTALMYQVRMFHICRLQRKIYDIPKSDFQAIKKRLKELLNL